MCSVIVERGDRVGDRKFFSLLSNRGIRAEYLEVRVEGRGPENRSGWKGEAS